MMKNWLKLMLLICLMAMASLSATAESGDCLVLPQDLKIIGEEAFMNLDSADKIVIPEGTTTIGARAFANGSFTEIELPESLSSIGDNAFYGCSGMTARVIPGSYAEKYCTDNGIRYITRSTPAEYFSYSIGETVTITGYNGPDKTVYIPAQIDGLNVTGIANRAFFGNRTVQSVYFSENITYFGDYVFENCTALTNVSLNEGITHIGLRSFAGCVNLSNLKMPKTLVSVGVSAFEHCDTFTEITFHDGLITLNNYAFAACDKLQKVNLPDSVASIGSGAFLDCVSLKEFDYPLGWVNVLRSHEDGYIFSGCISLKEITIPEGVTATPYNAFRGCTYIEKVNLPSTLVTIDGCTFEGCTALKEIELNEGLEHMGVGAFAGCTNLPNLEMPTTLVSTNNDVFMDCDSFTEITFHDGFLSLGGYTFRNCDNLVKVNLPDSVVDIGSGAFENCVSFAEFDYPLNWTNVVGGGNRGYVFNGCTSLKEITIPEGVTITPYGAFLGCTYIEKVNLPSTLVTINSQTFYGCTALKEIELNEGLQSINARAFENCVNLPNLTMPETLTVVESFAFANCDSFTELTFHDGLLTLGSNCFMHCDKLQKVNLPDSVTTIGECAFAECVSLTEFDYPLSWSKAGWNFSALGGILYGCPKITEIVVPEGIEYMPAYAFSNCNYIQKITLPSTMKEIGYRVFERCTALTECIIPSSVRVICQDAFQDCRALMDLYIPASTNFETNRDGWRFCFGGCNADFTIESEYGGIPIDYAKAFGLKYYYLSYTGRNVPNGIIYKGDTFNITGFVRSTLPLTDVTAKVWDSDGNVVLQAKVVPGVTDYSLADISEQFSIGSLPLGKYTFMLTGATEKSSETFAHTGFTIAPPPLRVYLRDYEPFSGFMNVDSAAKISGIVSANYDITSLAVQFFPSEDGSTVEYKVMPGVKSFDLSELNIRVSDLELDAYEMQIVVQGNGETKIVGQRSFSLTTEAVPDGFTVDYDLLSAFIGNAANRELFNAYQVDYTMRIEENMTETERFNLVMSQRKDYNNAAMRDTLEEILAGVDDKDTYLIELYKKEIADFIVDMGEEAETYQYDNAMVQAIAACLAQTKKIDIDFIGKEYGAIAEYDTLMLKGMGIAIEKVKDTTDFAENIGKLSAIVEDFYKDYSRGMEIMEYLETQYVGNAQYQYALEELKCEYYNNSYRVFNNLFTYAYQKAVEDLNDAVAEIALNALSGGLFKVYKIAGFAEEVLDKVYDIYGDSNDYVTYAIQCETYQNARAAYRDIFDLVAQDTSNVANIAKLQRSFEITRLSAIRALETLMDMKSYSCIDYTYPMMHLRELKKLMPGF